MTPTPDPALAAPDVIYLQDGGDYANAHEVTWCQHSVDDTDTAYMRLDLHTAAVQAAVAKAVEAITAERDAVQAELRVALGGCDANGGWAHRPISIPSAAKDIFCQDCGEMLDKATAKRHTSAAANRTPSETPAAVRQRGVAG